MPPHVFIRSGTKARPIEIRAGEMARPCTSSPKRASMRVCPDFFWGEPSAANSFRQFGFTHTHPFRAYDCDNSHMVLKNLTSFCIKGRLNVIFMRRFFAESSSEPIDWANSSPKVALSPLVGRQKRMPPAVAGVRR